MLWLQDHRFDCGERVECLLSERDLLFHHIQSAVGGRSRANIFWRRLGKGEGNLPFSPRDFTSSAWSCPAAITSSARPPCPGTRDRTAACCARPAFEGIFVRGERGFYQWKEGSFAAPAPETRAGLAEEQRRREELRRLRPRVIRHDALTLTIESAGPDQTVLLRHTYAPRTTLERSLAAGIQAIALVRPPLAQLYSLAFPSRLHPHRYGPFGFTDSLIHRRPSVLGLNLVLALALGALTWRRLRALKAPQSHVLFWCLAVLFFGLPAFVCFRAIETRRAWRRIPIAAAPPRPLLIESA